MKNSGKPKTPVAIRKLQFEFLNAVAFNKYVARIYKTAIKQKIGEKERLVFYRILSQAQNDVEDIQLAIEILKSKK